MNWHWQLATNKVYTLIASRVGETQLSVVPPSLHLIKNLLTRKLSSFKYRQAFWKMFAENLIPWFLSYWDARRYTMLQKIWNSPLKNLSNMFTLLCKICSILSLLQINTCSLYITEIYRQYTFIPITLWFLTVSFNCIL